MRRLYGTERNTSRSRDNLTRIETTLNIPDRIPLSAPVSEPPRSLVHPLRSLALVCLLLALSFTFASLYETHPVIAELTVELGQPLPSHPSDYLSGSRLTLSFVKIDLSEVDKTRCGNYTVSVSHGLERFTYLLHIRDTTAPEVSPAEEPFYFVPGTILEPEWFVADVLDADTETSIAFDSEKTPDSVLSCEHLGTYVIPVLVSDSSGNVTVLPASFTVDSPPEIHGVRDFWIAEESLSPDQSASMELSSLDLLDGISALDLVDGDVTGDITYRVSDTGNSVLYTVSDSYGLTGSAVCTLHIDTAEHIQKLIGSRTINRNDSHIVGAYNLYDPGRLPENDLGAALEDFSAAMVHLSHRFSEHSYINGSGFILEITDDGLYICTNEHVVSPSPEWEVFFADGSSAAGTLVGTTVFYDVGVVYVPLSKLPDGTLERIATVHIDEGYWNRLARSLSDRTGTELGLAHIDSGGGIEYTSFGALLSVHQVFEVYDGNAYTEITLPLIHGDSGSAILDGNGNLICMAFAFSLGPTRYWAIPLDGILASYEEITGRRPYTY